MPYIAGVYLEDEEMFQGFVMTVAMPDMPITDGVTTEVPADDLPGWIARELGLDPNNLTDRQASEIAQFITDYTL